MSSGKVCCAAAVTKLTAALEHAGYPAMPTTAWHPSLWCAWLAPLTIHMGKLPQC